MHARWLRVALLLAAALPVLALAHAPGASGTSNRRASPWLTAGAPETREGSAAGVAARARGTIEMLSPAHALGRPGGFDFQTATSDDGTLVVHSYGQYGGFGADFVRSAQQALRERVEPTLGYAPKSPINIYVYNSRSDFLSGAQPDQPDITGAFTVTQTSTIYMPDYSDMDVFSTLAHELTHAVFYQHEDVGHLSEDYYLYPRWLDEGMAESDVTPGGLDAQYDDGVFQRARGNGSLINIFHVFRWSYPNDLTTDNLCYAESRAFILSLKSTYGLDTFHAFVAAAADGNLDLAALKVFGSDMQTVQSGWLASVGLPSAPHSVAAPVPTSAPAPYTPIRQTGIAVATQPMGVPGGDAVAVDAIVKAALAEGVILMLLIVGWLKDRRRRHDAVAARLLSSIPSLLGAAQPEQGVSAAMAEPGAILSAPQARDPARDPAPLQTSVTTATLDRPRSARPARLPSAAWTALALAALPVSLAAGMVWGSGGPGHSWFADYRVGIIGLLAATLLAAGAALWATLARRRRVPGVWAMLALLACVALSLPAASGAGVAQAKVYEGVGAYALAARTLAEAGGLPADAAEIQRQWAQSAFSAGDFDAATNHAIAALTKPSALAKQDELAGRALLSHITLDWGATLTNVHQYGDAVGVYLQVLRSPACDADCAASLRDVCGDAYVAWARDLFAHHQTADGYAKLRALVRDVPKAQAATMANHVLQSTGGLAAALFVGEGGDAGAMDLLLEAFVASNPNAPEAAEASTLSQPVSGSISRADLYKTPLHVYWLAFASASDAAAYQANINVDSSLFKVATAADGTGKFSVWLPAGFTYVAIWEAPAKGDDDRRIRYSRGTYTVQPFTPLSTGEL